MKRLSLAVATLSAVCLTFQSAQASLLFSEAFNYTVGAGLSDQVNPGGQTWASGANSAALTIASGNLTYAGLADLGGNSLQINNGITGTSTYITYADQTAGQIYYSFLFQTAGANSANTYFIGLNPSDASHPAPNGSSDAIDAYYYSGGDMRLRANALSATSSGVTLNYNQTYLIVEMIDLDARTASMWVDPSSATFGGTAPTPDAMLTGTSTSITHIDDVGFKAQSSAGGPYLVDSVRVGTTWADVTPAGIPEPSVLALAGLGIFGFISAARRRMRR